VREHKFKALFENQRTGIRTWFYVGVGDKVMPEWGARVTEWLQYTGLKDRNGTELYEKDIILYDSKRLFVIVFNKYGQFCVKSPEDLQDEIYAGYCIPDSKKIERIGNIYENPELMKEGSVWG